MEREREDVDALADLFAPTSPAEIVVAPPAGAISAAPVERDPLEELMDKVLTDSLQVVSEATRFAEIAPGTTEPPEAWVRELGPEGAMRRLRVCQGAWMGSKEAPKGLDIAKSIASSLALAKCKKQEVRDRSLKVELAVFPAFTYGRIEVSSDD